VRSEKRKVFSTGIEPRSVSIPFAAQEAADVRSLDVFLTRETPVARSPIRKNRNFLAESTLTFKFHNVIFFFFFNYEAMVLELARHIRSELGLKISSSVYQREEKKA
jgi:hypothetical protein